MKFYVIAKKDSDSVFDAAYVVTTEDADGALRRILGVTDLSQPSTRELTIDGIIRQLNIRGVIAHAIKPPILVLRENE